MRSNFVETQQPHAEERATRASRSMGSKRLSDLSSSALVVLEFVFLVDPAVGLVPLRQRLAAAQRSRHQRPAGCIGIAPACPRGDFLAGDSGRLANDALAGAAPQIAVLVNGVIDLRAPRP